MIYPYDDEGAALMLLPAVAARGAGGEHYMRLVRPLLDLDAQVGAMVDALVDVQEASGPGLELLGLLVGERSDGLDLREHRTIVAGRLAARPGAYTAPRVWQVWTLLTDTTDASFDEDAGYLGFELVGDLHWYPTDLWVSRARHVIRDAVLAGVPFAAEAVPPDGARFDDPASGWDVGTFSHSLGAP